MSNILQNCINNFQIFSRIKTSFLVTCLKRNRNEIEMENVTFPSPFKVHPPNCGPQLKQHFDLDTARKTSALAYFNGPRLVCGATFSFFPFF